MSDLLKSQSNKTMEESGLDYTKAVMYKVVADDLSDLSDVKYDVLVFSPLRVLLHYMKIFLNLYRKILE